MVFKTFCADRAKGNRSIAGDRSLELSVESFEVDVTSWPLTPPLTPLTKMLRARMPPVKARKAMACMAICFLLAAICSGVSGLPFIGFKRAKPEPFKGAQRGVFMAEMVSNGEQSRRN